MPTNAPFLAILLTAFGLYGAHAQETQTLASEAPGPWLLGTIGIGKQADGSMKTTALKGLAIKVGERGETAVCYDLDLCRMAGAWTGKFTTPMNLISSGEYPTALGEVAFTTSEIPGLLIGEAAGRGGSQSHPFGDTETEKEATDAASGRLSGPPQPWSDPRPEPFGPLPLGQARFKGFNVSGDQVAVKWEINGTQVTELPEAVQHSSSIYLSRRFSTAPSARSIQILLPDSADTFVRTAGRDPPAFICGNGRIDFQEIQRQDPKAAEELLTLFRSFEEHDRAIKARVSGIKIMDRRGYSVLEIPAGTAPIEFRVVRRLKGPRVLDASVVVKFASDGAHLNDFLQSKTAAEPNRWLEDCHTAVEVSEDNAAYVVDTIVIPFFNRWNIPMLISGFDFFSDGRAAICTLSGDVFLVDGVYWDKSSAHPELGENADWHRFAHGLFHPLGLKIVKDEIYVTCRDGLWRLKDFRGNHLADSYEAFNFDLKVTKNPNEFVSDLQTDEAGNFYFAKAAPIKKSGRGFGEIISQHGTFMRVSPDGARLDVMATGFRAPNGIGVGPRGELTASDTEAAGLPCKINWIKPGGFYGCAEAAHLTPPPTSFDWPLCWLPPSVDNGGGSQVWVPDDDRWGSWRGKMLHLSHGRAALYGVMCEEVAGLVQGGVTKFPLEFQSGIMRARFSPKDGQLYVAGMRGSQNAGLKNGCLQRVRYTGVTARMPIEIHASKDGIELRFTCSLDPQRANDPKNWRIEQFANAHAKKTPYIPVKVRSARVSADDRTVFLEIPNLKSTMQMSIKYDLNTADGNGLQGKVVNTVHALGASEQN